MTVPETTIMSVPHFLHELEAYPSELYWIFRGQSDDSWPLIPKAGRIGYFHVEKSDSTYEGFPPRDICRFNYWREQAVAYQQTLPSNDFECLALAQHYGLATRLLDWSTNPLVALYFAVECCSASQGVVYCFGPKDIIRSSDCKLTSVDRIAEYIPPPFDRRITAQSGVFTYHPHPQSPIVLGDCYSELGEMRPEHGKNMFRLLIPSKLKPAIKRRLVDLGISRRSLFPDLDGLSAFINSETTPHSSLMQSR